MAVTAYTGLQGHGKTYEVVKNVILANLLRGRRIVTNIAGLKDDAIADYLVEKYQADRSKLGTIVHVSNAEVELPYFYPWENMDKGVTLKVKQKSRSRFSTFEELVDYEWPEGVEPTSIVKGGDIVVLDEVWRWYASGEKVQPAHMFFFRQHRHFLHPETGVACDIVLIIQVIDDFQSKVLKVIEKNFLMQKHKALGIDNRYVVNCYNGYRQSEKNFVEGHQETYQPEIYNLYSSYSQSTSNQLPNEKAADSRGKIWNRWHIKVGLPLAVLSLIMSFVYMWRFFHPAPKDAAPVTAKVDKSSDKLDSSASSSSSWRVVGVLSNGSAVFVILSDDKNRLRYLFNPANFRAVGSAYEVTLPEGGSASSWSGSLPSASPAVAQGMRVFR